MRHDLNKTVPTGVISTVLEERFPRLWPLLERLSILILASLLFLLFSLPVLTIPVALCGLVRAIRPLATGGRTGHLVADFWSGMKENLVQGTLGGLIGLLFTTSAWLWVVMLWRGAGTTMHLVGWLFVWVGVFGLMVNVYLWPLMAWYPQPAFQALKRAASLSVAHPLWALLGVLAPPVAVVVPFLLGVSLRWLLPFYLVIGPSLAAALSACFAWQAMQRYAPDAEFSDGVDPFEANER